jgi:hypothetical protein
MIRVRRPECPVLAAKRTSRPRRQPSPLAQMTQGRRMHSKNTFDERCMPRAQQLSYSSQCCLVTTWRDPKLSHKGPAHMTLIREARYERGFGKCSSPLHICVHDQLSAQADLACVWHFSDLGKCPTESAKWTKRTSTVAVTNRDFMSTRPRTGRNTPASFRARCRSTASNRQSTTEPANTPATRAAARSPTAPPRSSGCAARARGRWRRRSAPPAPGRRA